MITTIAINTDLLGPDDAGEILWVSTESAELVWGILETAKALARLA